MVRTDGLVDSGGRSQLGVLQHSGHRERVVDVRADTVVADSRVHVVRTLLLVTLRGEETGVSVSESDVLGSVSVATERRREMPAVR